MSAGARTADLLAAASRATYTPRRQCRHCMVRLPEDEVYSARRFGGGDYRRPGRWYSSSLCGGCALTLAQYAANCHGRMISRWDKRDVLSIAALAAEATLPSTCRHCLRPITMHADGYWYDDRPHPRTCYRALSYEHKPTEESP